MNKCDDDCNVCYLKSKAMCSNKTIVINSNVDINNDDDIKEFIRGTRARLPMIDDNWLVPQEIIDEVIKPFIRKGIEDEHRKTD